MAESPSYAQASTQDLIEDLREDIELNTAILASLGDEDSDTETEDSRRAVSRSLKEMKNRLKQLTRPKSPTTPPQLDGAADDMPPTGGSKSTQSTFNLVNRKRQRGELDDEIGSRGSKSLRGSPALSASDAPSPRPSASATDDDLDLDDGFFTQIMSKEEIEEQKAYLKSLDERKKQEQADEELARSFNVPDTAPASSSTTVQRPSLPAASSQAFFRGDGTFRGPAKQEPTPAVNAYQPPPKPQFIGVDEVSSGVNTPATSEDSFEEISRDMFTPRQPQPYAYGPQSMPGAFPGVYPPYVNQPGASVYNNPLTGQPQVPGAYALTGTNLVNAKLGLEGHSAYARNILNNFHPWDDDADPAKTAEEIKDLLKHIRPDEELTDEQLAEMPTGLTRPLMPHQISGLAWMKKMEEGTNKGGILADDMGLGKTVQAIALMLARPAPEGDRRPNLVVAPVALMHQWKRELDKFVNRRNKFNIITLHGPGRPEDYRAIRNADVVLTTYGTLASELKRRLVYEDKCKHAADPSSIRENCAILGEKSKFHRVFLDEAQNIKNRNTKAAIAACRIAATHRWALSGTPMQNSVEEMYSLIKFCRIRPYNNWDKFSKDISRPLKSRSEVLSKRGMQILQALLKAMLLRRTKDSKLNGKPILQLPPKTTVEDRAIMGKDQKEFYEALEKSSQIQFNRYLKNNSIGRHYSHALVLLLRLRQACCHPTLIVNSKDFQQTVSELAPMDMIENAKLLSDSVVERLKRESLDGFECPVCMDAHEDPTIFQCGHAICQDCLAKLTDAALSSEEGAQASCPHCRAKISADKVTDLTSFLRVYCPEREGVEQLEDIVGGDHASDSDSDSDSSDDVADDSDDDGADLADFIVDDEADVEYDESDKDELESAKSKPEAKVRAKANSKDKVKKKSKSKKGKGKAKAKDSKSVSLGELRKAGLKSKAAKKKYLKRLSKDWVSSTKIDKTIALLEEIHARGEGEKTIVFSSFTSFLDLLEVPLSRHDDLSTYSRYDGSMNAAARNDAVLDFTDKPACKTILVSLKAGNAGLNLTAANHVILLDPFWNPFVEYQAADRCYRIGQERDVTIHRVLIGREDGNDDLENPHTVEDRILKLQEKKRHLVETALDERAGSQLGRLGVRELGYLFGVNSL